MTAPTPELATTLEPTVTDRLLQAEAMVRTWCGWHIAPERDDTFMLDGPGGPNLVLPTLHLTDVVSVTEGGTLLDPAVPDYQWSQAGVITRIRWASWQWFDPSVFDDFGTGPNSWSSDDQSIVVEVTHGYPDVPADVTSVVQRVAQRLVDNPAGLVQETVGPFHNQYGTSDLLTPGDLAVLARYRLPTRP